MILDNTNYYSPKANKEYFSVSQFKSFMKCEAGALADLNGEVMQKSTTALLVGSYVDSYFSGELNAFIDEYADEIINKRTGELKADYSRASDIIRRIESDKMFMDFMSGDTQTIMTAELFGYYWKIKTDSLHSDKIVDLKIMKSFEPVYVQGEGKMHFIDAWGYDIQGAVYQKIVELNTGKKLPFYIAAATKETVTDINIFQIPQEKLDVALKIVEYNIDRIAEVKAGLEPPKRCGKCDYCKTTKVLTEPTIYSEEETE